MDEGQYAAEAGKMETTDDKKTLTAKFIAELLKRSLEAKLELSSVQSEMAEMFKSLEGTQAELDKEERAPQAPTAPLKANGIKRTKAPAPAANESDSSEDLPAKKSRRILESDEDSDPRPRKKLI